MNRVQQEQEEIQYSRGDDLECPRCKKMMGVVPRTIVIGKFITCGPCHTDWHVATYAFEGFMAGNFGLIPVEILPEPARSEYYASQRVA